MNYSNTDIELLAQQLIAAFTGGGSGTKSTFNYDRVENNVLNISGAYSVSIANIGTANITVNEVPLSPGDPAINAADMINGLNTIQVVASEPGAIAFITYLTK